MKDKNRIQSYGGVLIVAAILMFIVMTVTRDNALIINIKGAMGPIFGAFALAYLMDNGVRFFERKTKLSRGFSVLITILIFISIIIVVLAVAIPRIIESISALIISISNIDIKQLNEFLYQFNFDNEYILEIQNYITETFNEILEALSSMVGTALTLAMNSISSITSGILNAFLAFVIAIYILLDKEDLLARIKRMTRAFISEKFADRLFYATGKANYFFQSFVVGKLIDSMIIGIIFYIFTVIFNVKYGIIYALIIGITNMIPYFGPFIGGIPVGFFTFINDPSQLLMMVILIFALQQFDGLVLGPLILGDRIGVSAFWIIVAVTVGGGLFGVLGMFLGVPVLVLIKTLLEEEVQMRLNGKNIGIYEAEKLKENQPATDNIIKKIMEKA